MRSHMRGASRWLLTCTSIAVILQAGSGETRVRAARAQSMPSAREAYADLPGVRIWYTDTGGNGVPVVFLHAATGSVRVWEHQIPVFAKAGYRFIAYDRRGL